MNQSTLTYQNDFLSVNITPLPGSDGASVLCCFSVNLRRFDPLARGTYGICSNPAFRGLQLLRAALSAEVRERGMSSRRSEGEACRSFMPRGEGWYHDSLVVDQVPASYAQQLLIYGTRALLAKVLSVCRPDQQVPDPLPDPAGLQAWIESLTERRS